MKTSAIDTLYIWLCVDVYLCFLHKRVFLALMNQFLLLEGVSTPTVNAESSGKHVLEQIAKSLSVCQNPLSLPQFSYNQTWYIPLESVSRFILTVCLATYSG
jgi:hypothetical protein